MSRKRVLTIQDYSCMGRCSLTVALPTISAMGIECVGIPTAVLSNHTQFKSWTFKDLSDQILPIIGKWGGYDHEFDMIYTGYLGNEQIPTVIELIKRLSHEGGRVYVDPAMADDGKLYPGFDHSHVVAMRELLDYADYAKPNLTEACLLTDTPYPADGKGDISLFRELAKKLSSYGPRVIILSGATFEEGKTGVYCYYAESGREEYFQKELLAWHYHGTGDLFSSAAVGGLVLGKSPIDSCELAHDYVSEAIRYSVLNHTDGLTYGPDFEPAIPYLCSKI